MTIPYTVNADGFVVAANQLSGYIGGSVGKEIVIRCDTPRS